MGGAYTSPNFSSLLKTVILMISDKAMLAKYPLDELNSAVVAHKDILQKMIEPGESSSSYSSTGYGYSSTAAPAKDNADFTDILLTMAHENEKVSKKMAKAYLRAANKTGIDSLQSSLKKIRKFLSIQDSLKQARMEWIFGIPQIVAKQQYRTRQHQYGLELLENIGDEYYIFKSGFVKGVSEGFLGQLYKAKGKMDTQCVIGIR